MKEYFVMAGIKEYDETGNTFSIIYCIVKAKTNEEAKEKAVTKFENDWCKEELINQIDPDNDCSLDFDKDGISRPIELFFENTEETEWVL